MKRVLHLLLPPAIALALTSCSRENSPAEPAAPPPPGVSVSLAQWRSDEPAHRLQVAVRNTGDTPVYFSDLQLVTESFTTLPPQKTEAVIPRTNRTDLPIPYGQANCDPAGVPPLKPATVVAHLRVGDEPLRQVAFPLPHPDPLLTRLLRDECSAFLIKQAADIAFAPQWREQGKQLHGTLTVTRRSGTTPLTLQSIDGTTHYIINPASGRRRPMATLDGTAKSLEIPVVVTPGRCDPHAFAEAKKAHLFPVRASLGQDQERVVIVSPDQQAQRLMVDYARRTCGLA
ncbi:hypothetical protein [Thermoactinospora rubra]|uniref:hypothetical protein n=1 Tax=Thermoactinospora rubra TaxID=1088767 RepID=UPI001181602D|nr:hypothetical protein [Thermoactinospora rubra]